jgi:hypothetical protein
MITWKEENAMFTLETEEGLMRRSFINKTAIGVGVI